jgi:hypothetical protein
MLVGYQRRGKQIFYYLTLVAAILACAMIFQACGKKSPTDASSKDLVSFEDFKLNNQILETPDCAADCVALKKEFRYVQYVGEEIYCYWDEKKKLTGIDFKVLANQLESRITNNTKTQDYYLILMEWAAAFYDGHVNVIAPDQILQQFEFYDPNVRFELIAPTTAQEKLIVSRIGADVETLKIGTEVQLINGKPWQEYFDKALLLTSGSTERMRRRSAARRIPIVLGFEQGFQDILVEGEFTGQKLSERVSRELNLNDGQSGSDEVEITGKELIKARILSGNIGYLRIDGFEGSKMPELLSEAMAKLMSTSGLLIDVRYNGGGDQSGNSVIQHLIQKKTSRYSQQVRGTDTLMALRPQYVTNLEFLGGDWSEIWQAQISPKSPLYTKPVVVLTSSYCFSACDTFVSALKEHGLAKIVGESTGGGTGSPVVFRLPESGLQFRYSVVKGYTPMTQQMIEGVGTKVDVEILQTIQERAAGRDEQLKKSLNYLLSLISTGPQPVPSDASVVFDSTPLITDTALKELDREIRIQNREMLGR